MSEAFERRITRLEAIDHVKRLTAGYCAFRDAQYDFLADGSRDRGSTFGRHVDRDAIRACFASVRNEIRFATHLVLNSIMGVQYATRSTVFWRLPMPSAARGGATTNARWRLCASRDETIRADPHWMFQSSTIQLNRVVSHLKS